MLLYFKRLAKFDEDILKERERLKYTRFGVCLVFFLVAYCLADDFTAAIYTATHTLSHPHLQPPDPMPLQAPELESIPQKALKKGTSDDL